MRHSREVTGEQVDNLTATLIGSQSRRAFVPRACTDQDSRSFVDDGVPPADISAGRFTIYPHKERLTAARVQLTDAFPASLLNAAC